MAAGADAGGHPAAGSVHRRRSRRRPRSGAGSQPAGHQRPGVNGANPGEVVITWDAVPEAAYYRFGYVNMVTDYPAAKANGNWLEAFIYVDIANRGQTSYTFRRLEPGVRHAFSVLTNNSRYANPPGPPTPGGSS